MLFSNSFQFFLQYCIIPSTMREGFGKQSSSIITFETTYKRIIWNWEELVEQSCNHLQPTNFLSGNLKWIYLSRRRKKTPDNYKITYSMEILYFTFSSPYTCPHVFLCTSSAWHSTPFLCHLQKSIIHVKNKFKLFSHRQSEIRNKCSHILRHIILSLGLWTEHFSEMHHAALSHSRFLFFFVLLYLSSKCLLQVYLKDFQHFY